MSRLNRRNPYSTVRSAAEHYWRIGLEPVSLDTSEVGESEIPSVPVDWSPETLDRKFGASDRVGVILGSRSGDLVEVQVHWQEAGGWAVNLMKDFPAFRRGGPEYTNYLARSKLRTGLIQFKVPNILLPVVGGDQGVVLELKGNGHQAIVPPSVDPAGERTRWRRGYLALRYADDVPFVSPAWLIARSSLLAAMAVIHRAYPHSCTNTDDLLQEITAVLLHLGCEIEVVDGFIAELCNASSGWKPEYRRNTARAIKVEIAETGHVADIVAVCRLLGIEPMEDLLRSWIDPFGDLFPKEPNRHSVFDKQ